MPIRFIATVAFALLLIPAALGQSVARYRTVEKAVENPEAGARIILNLTDAGLDNLPAQISDIKNLYGIELSGNDMNWQAVIDRLAAIPTLRQVIIADAGLKALPESVRKLTQIEHLDLSYNELETIQKEIRQLTNLKYLNVSHNVIEDLPALNGMKGLEVLCIEHNEISDLSGRIGGISNLRTLKANDNRLNEVIFIAEVGSLVNLEVLDLSNNGMARLPNRFSSLTKLRELYLDGNDLDRTPRELSSLSSLRIISVKNNKLEEKDLRRLGRVIPHARRVIY